jgi:hypothetical protein
MQAVHTFEISRDSAQNRSASRLVPWLKDLGAGFGLIAFIGSSFVLLDVLSALFA